MATTHLTEQEAQELGIPTLIRRVQSGEEISITRYGKAVAVLSMENARLDPSLDATIARLEHWEREHGETLTMGLDFADDLETIIASRKPSDTTQWG
jgi:antitoxin (DNA-binding transcriptional repressor) of toxin-antitoxin stability system